MRWQPAGRLLMVIRRLSFSRHPEPDAGPTFSNQPRRFSRTGIHHPQGFGEGPRTAIPERCGDPRRPRTAESCSPSAAGSLACYRVAAALLVLVVAGRTVWLLLSSNGPQQAPVTPIPLTSYRGAEYWPTFSPDGNQVAFSWDGENQDNFDV
jgi:hypothetical protein